MGHEDSHEDYIMWLQVLRKYGDARGDHKFSSTYTVDIPATSTPGEKSRHCTVEGCDARTDVTELPPIEGDFPWGKV